MTKRLPAFAVEQKDGQWYLVTRTPIFRVPESIAVGVPAIGRTDLFTKQEKRIFSLILQGKANKEIATEVGAAIGTIKFHVTNILHKTGCARRGELLLRELNRKGETGEK